MRMWMVDPRILCRNHLLGEHSEIHKHRHTFVKQHSIAKRYGQIQPLAMASRHDALAAEMCRRNYKHDSPYTLPDLSYLPPIDCNGTVDVTTSLNELLYRCTDCWCRYYGIEESGYD